MLSYNYLCQTCVRDVEKLINLLRQNIQKEENTLRKLFRRAGEAKIICRQMKRLFRLGMAETPELVLAPVLQLQMLRSILF